MAKKSFGDVVLGRGRKQCPACGAIVAARASVCKQCGHQFVASGRRRVPRIRVAPLRRARGGAPAAASPDAEDKVIEFANQHGGLSAATQWIEDVVKLQADSRLQLEAIQTELQRLNKILNAVQQ